MTSIGKIFVLIITILNVFLLAVSAAVLATRTDWKANLAELDEKAKSIQDTTTRISEDAKKRQDQLAYYQGLMKSQEASFAKEKIDPIVQDINKYEKENAAARAAVIELHQNAGKALTASRELAQQVEVVSREINARKQQKEEFDRQNQELQDRIFNLRRQIDVAKTHRSDLGGGDRVAAFPRANP